MGREPRPRAPMAASIPLLHRAPDALWIRCQNHRSFQLQLLIKFTNYFSNYIYWFNYFNNYIYWLQLLHYSYNVLIYFENMSIHWFSFIRSLDYLCLVIPRSGTEDLPLPHFCIISWSVSWSDLLDIWSDQGLLLVLVTSYSYWH